MIVSQTPYRLSFFGGGTDYPAWYEKYGGAVISTTIDKYCYLTCRYLPPFFDHKSRIVYSKIESVTSNDQIQHPAVRATLQLLGITDGIELHHDGDLPARTGIGTSSSFTVGLLHALYALKRMMPSKLELATQAIHVEQKILKENVGVQDQIAVAYGGLNKIDISKDSAFQIHPIILPGQRLLEFQDHLMLFFTGFSRYASEVAKKQIDKVDQNKAALSRIFRMVDEAIDILVSGTDICEFGHLLNESWELKKSLSDGVSTGEINAMYEEAKSAGALGGKILGAGGGGFMVLFAKPGDQPKIRERLSKLLLVPFRFENSGSQIAFYRPTSRKSDRLDWNELSIKGGKDA